MIVSSRFVSSLRACVVLLAATAGCAAQTDKPAAPGTLVSASKPEATPAASAPAPTATTTSAPTAATSGFPQRSPRYHIEPGDTFDLNFELSPEFNLFSPSVGEGTCR